MEKMGATNPFLPRPHSSISIPPGKGKKGVIAMQCFQTLSISYTKVFILIMADIFCT